MKNKINTPLQLVNVIVYDNDGGTVGEIQMKLLSLYIPESIEFVDHWLYELRKIYEETDDENPKDWTI